MAVGRGADTGYMLTLSGLTLAISHLTSAQLTQPLSSSPPLSSQALKSCAGGSWLVSAGGAGAVDLTVCLFEFNKFPVLFSVLLLLLYGVGGHYYYTEAATSAVLLKPH